MSRLHDSRPLSPTAGPTPTDAFDELAEFQAHRAAVAGRGVFAKPGARGAERTGVNQRHLASLEGHGHPHPRKGKTKALSAALAAALGEMA